MTIKLQTRRGWYHAVIRYQENGMTKTKSESLRLTVDASQEEVEAKLQIIKEKYEKLYPEPEGILFTTYLDNWVTKRKGFVANSTWEGYCVYARKHIIPYFEQLHLELKELTPAHIRDYYHYKYTGGRMDGKEGGLAIESIIKHKSLLMPALDDAVLEELIPTNPAKYVKLPAKRSSSRKENFLDARQAQKMLNALEGTELYALVYTALFYGLRKSELLGLRWSAIDFAKNTLTVERSVVKNLTVEEKETLKTAASYHTYHLIDDVRCVLLWQRGWQQRNREKCGPSYKENDCVFTREDGRPFRPDTVLRSFQRALKRNGLPVIRLHDLRHSTASILYERGWDLKDIQMWLRHADIKVTANVYTHIKSIHRDNIPDCVKNVFAPTPKPTATILPPIGG